VQLSGNPLPVKQREFLESGNPLGFNKTAYQKDILNHIEKSVRYLHHILKNAYNLKKDDLYNSLNSQTLTEILESLLTDFEQKGRYKNEKFDFRTVELARTLFHISAIFLIKSPLWNNKKFVQTDIDRLSYYFEALADSALDKESYYIIKEDDERKMQEKLEKLREKEEFIKEKGEWHIYNNQYQKCQDKLNAWNNRKVVFESIEDKTNTIKKEIEILKELIDGIKKAIMEIQSKRENSLKEIKENRDKIYEKLSHKYDHLKNFFCSYNKLGPFEWEKNPYLVDEKIQPQMFFPNYDSQIFQANY